MGFSNYGDWLRSNTLVAFTKLFQPVSSHINSYPLNSLHDLFPLQTTVTESLCIINK